MGSESYFEPGFIGEVNKELFTFFSKHVEKVIVLADGEICRINKDNFFYLDQNSLEWKNIDSKCGWAYPPVINIKFSSVNDIYQKLKEYLVDKDVYAYIRPIKPDSIETHEMMNLGMKIIREFSFHLVRLK